MSRYYLQRSPGADTEWHVYAPTYAGEIRLSGGVYEGRPFTRVSGWPVATFSTIDLAAEYVVEATR